MDALVWTLNAARTFIPSPATALESRRAVGSLPPRLALHSRAHSRAAVGAGDYILRRHMSHVELSLPPLRL